MYNKYDNKKIIEFRDLTDNDKLLWDNYGYSEDDFKDDLNEFFRRWPQYETKVEYYGRIVFSSDEVMSGFRLGLQTRGINIVDSNTKLNRRRFKSGIKTKHPVPILVRDTSGKYDKLIVLAGEHRVAGFVIEDNHIHLADVIELDLSTQEGKLIFADLSSVSNNHDGGLRPDDKEIKKQLLRDINDLKFVPTPGNEFFEIKDHLIKRFDDLEPAHIDDYAGWIVAKMGQSVNDVFWSVPPEIAAADSMGLFGRQVFHQKKGDLNFSSSSYGTVEDYFQGGIQKLVSNDFKDKNNYIIFRLSNSGALSRKAVEKKRANVIKKWLYLIEVEYKVLLESVGKKRITEAWAKNPIHRLIFLGFWPQLDKNLFSAEKGVIRTNLDGKTREDVEGDRSFRMASMIAVPDHPRRYLMRRALFNGTNIKSESIDTAKQEEKTFSINKTKVIDPKVLSTVTG